MAVSLIETVRKTMSSPRGGKPMCLVCSKPVGREDERLRMRGGSVVHKECATYDMRRRRSGTARLGYPPRPA